MSFTHCSLPGAKSKMRLKGEPRNFALSILLFSGLQQFIAAYHPHLKPMPTRGFNHAAMYVDRPVASPLRTVIVRLGASLIHDFIFGVLLSCFLFLTSFFLTALSACKKGFPTATVMLHLGFWTPFFVGAASSILGLLLQLFLRVSRAAKTIKAADAVHTAQLVYAASATYSFQAAQLSYMMTSSGLIITCFALDIVYFGSAGEPRWLLIFTCSSYLWIFFLLIQCHSGSYVRREVEHYLIGLVDG